MSSNEFKCGFRVNLEKLRGKSKKEALAYFESVLGKPEGIDNPDDDMYFSFWYPRDSQYQPMQEYSYNYYPSKDDGWVVDYIIHRGYEGEIDPSMYLSVKTIIKVATSLASKFDVPVSDITVFAYTWYNGTDEPVLLQHSQNENAVIQ